MAWVLLVGLVVGLFAFTGMATAGAEDQPPASTCKDGSAGQEVSLPSGATETFCYGTQAPAGDDGGAVTNATPTITLAKTVGTDDGTCSDQDAIEVNAGTEVFYCYTVQNTGSVTVSMHDLEDDQLGNLVTDLEYELGPGASTYVTASATINVDTVNVATWTATDGVTPAESVDTAIVTITADEVPGAPTITGATPAEGEVALTWDAPSDDGGSPITGYKVTPYIGSNPGTTINLGSTATSTVVDGLVNGTAYTFRVAAVNAIGTGPESAASGEVTPQWWLPWSSGTVAVTELYTWFTGVPPTSGQLSSQLAALNGNTKLPGDVVAELRSGTDATSNVNPTVRLYSAYFLRIPDPGGLNFWLGRRRSGWTLSQISSNFAGSSEFVNTYGSLTNQEFVELVYQNVLHRAGEPSGVAFWTNRLNNGTNTRGQVMLNFSESNEYKTAEVNNVQAAVIYIHLLGRAPTQVERDAFASDLESTPLATLVRALIHQPSFDTRAG